MKFHRCSYLVARGECILHAGESGKASLESEACLLSPGAEQDKKLWQQQQVTGCFCLAVENRGSPLTPAFGQSGHCSCTRCQALAVVAEQCPATWKLESCLLLPPCAARHGGTAATSPLHLHPPAPRTVALATSKRSDAPHWLPGAATTGICQQWRRARVTRAGPLLYLPGRQPLPFLLGQAPGASCPPPRLVQPICLSKGLTGGQTTGSALLSRVLSWPGQLADEGTVPSSAGNRRAPSQVGIPGHASTSSLLLHQVLPANAKAGPGYRVNEHQICPGQRGQPK